MSASEQHCPGNDSDWAVKNGIWLAGEDITSVLELRLCDPISDEPIRDDETAWSIAFALRYGLVQRLGINPQEVGVAVQDVADITMGGVKAIYLYDTATSGAGYVSQLPEQIDFITSKALELLDCQEECDSACNSCLIDWDSQHQAEYLNREKAAQFLTKWQEHAQLPLELQGISENIRAELTGVIQSLKQTAYVDPPEHILLFVGSQADELCTNYQPIDEDCPATCIASNGCIMGGTLRRSC